MTEENKHGGGFWRSLPALLTALATLVGTIAYIYFASRQTASQAPPPPKSAKLPDKPNAPPQPQKLEFKEVASGPFVFKFKNITLHPPSDTPGRYRTSVSFRIYNSSKEPVEIALNAATQWPSLEVDGVALAYKTISVLPPYWAPITECTRRIGQWQFVTLQPNDHVSATVEFWGTTQPGKLDNSKFATLTGSLIYRPPKVGDCIAVSIPGDDIPLTMTR